tara:strand:+ start:256 stop:603 length:348 start_codon:yes stop_codon:yes gene_type:complete
MGYIYICKTEGVRMKAFAWRRETNDNRANYCLQVENIKGKRALNKVVKILGDWEVIGDGYNAKTEEYTMIFSTNFDNPGKWQNWAEEFPIYLVEVTSHGNEKIRNKKLIKAGAVL